MCPFPHRSDKIYGSDRSYCEENDCTLSLYSYGYSDSESVGDDFMGRRSASVSTTSSSSRPRKRHRSFSKHCSRNRGASKSRSKCRSPSRAAIPRSFGVLPLEYWERTKECQEAKYEHMEKLDRLCESREMLVLNTTLLDCHIALEKNMFPCKSVIPFCEYTKIPPPLSVCADNTPKGVEHYTLWSDTDMSHQEICDYVNSWLRRHLPHATRYPSFPSLLMHELVCWFVMDNTFSFL